MYPYSFSTSRLQNNRYICITAKVYGILQKRTGDRGIGVADVTLHNVTVIKEVDGCITGCVGVGNLKYAGGAAGHHVKQRSRRGRAKTYPFVSSINIKNWRAAISILDLEAGGRVGLVSEGSGAAVGDGQDVTGSGGSVGYQ